jgi:hypothetical protein
MTEYKRRYVQSGCVHRQLLKNSSCVFSKLTFLLHVLKVKGITEMKCSAFPTTQAKELQLRPQIRGQEKYIEKFVYINLINRPLEGQENSTNYPSW